MSRNRHIARCPVYTYRILFFLFCFLNSWASFSYAHHPNGTGGTPSGTSSSNGENLGALDGTSSGTEGQPPVAASDSPPPGRSGAGGPQPQLPEDPPGLSPFVKAVRERLRKMEVSSWGEGATASSQGAAALGQGATASGEGVTASSKGSTSGTVTTASSKGVPGAGTEAIAVGKEAALGLRATASGTGATSSGTGATTTGTGARTSATGATASGTGATASGTGATASGTGATASETGATASRTGATASGTGAIASVKGKTRLAKRGTGVMMGTSALQKRIPVSAERSTASRGEAIPALARHDIISPSRGWCMGPVFPVSVLPYRKFRLPTIQEVMQAQCQEWMTHDDVKGLKSVLQHARNAQSTIITGLHFFPEASVLQREIPAGSVFVLDLYDMPGTLNIENPVFMRGYVIAKGSWGIVTAIKHMPQLSSFPTIEEEPENEDQGSSATGAQFATRRKSRFKTAMGQVSRAFQGIGRKFGGASTRRRHAGCDGKKLTAEESPASTSTQASSVDSVRPSSRASPQSPGASSSEAAASEQSFTGEVYPTMESASLRSVVGGGSSSALPALSPSETLKFTKELATQLVEGIGLETFYVAKVALTTDKYFPENFHERLEASDAIIEERLTRTLDVLKVMPATLSADTLYRLGFVLPVAAGRVSGKTSYIGSSRFSSMHVINYVQLLRPQLTDIFSIHVRDSNGIRYMVKRLIQLGAHLVATGVVHMDIKRENLGVSPLGEMTLLDFDYAQAEGTTFPCNMKPTIEVSAPEIARSTLRFIKTGRTVNCIAHRSIDAWDIGMTLLELVCMSQQYFSCYNTNDSTVGKLQCLASLQPSFVPAQGMSLSPTRAPIKWDNCNPPRDIRAVIEGLLDLNPGRRLDPLKAFVYSDLFRGPR